MRKWTIMLAMTITLIAKAQTAKEDTIKQAIHIGYSNGSLSTLAGAIDKVTEERMNKGLVISSLDALSGQAAGVQVSSGSNQEAMVSAVRVRGTTSLTGGNDPLVIIDGVTADLTTLSTIYPSDIESFTILKDASETAQYGSRGAAGVIEVATKKGRNQQFHISYNGTMGFEAVHKRVNMLNAAQFRQTASYLGLNIIDKGDDINFNKSIERTGFVQNHHIAFGGGSETANYRASVGLTDHKTVIRNNNFTNYTAKLDLHQKAFDNHLAVDLGVFGSIQKSNYLPFKQKLLYSAATFNPTFPDGANVDGSFNQVTEAIWINNPNALLMMQQDEDDAHLNIHLNAAFKLSKGLTLKFFGSYSYSMDNNAHYYPTYVWSYGEAYRGNVKHEELLNRLTLDYTLELKQSTLNITALTERQDENTNGFYTTVSNFYTDAFGYDKLSAGSAHPWGGTDSHYIDAHMQSFLFRAQYTLADKYTFTINARADGSSKVGANHRWGFFPSISGSWIISQEAWMHLPDFVSNAKLRIGYGHSGNLGGIDSYNSMQLIQPNGVVPVWGTNVTTLGIIRNANPDLRWEIKKSFNIGFDLSFWNKRIALTIDYYKSKTTDMLYLYDVPVPPYPYESLLANLGSMKNSGLEIGFGITPLQTKDMDLSISMNWSFERNKLLSLDGDFNGQHLTAPSMKSISALWGAGFHGASDVVMQVVGEPIGVFVLPHCNGLINWDDGTSYYDITAESYICGQATPKARMGSNIAFRYKQWDITMQMNGAFGHKIYNGTALTYMNMLSMPNYNVMEGAPEMHIFDQTISDYWLEDGDYVNIDYLTIGWTMPIRSRFVQNLRLSASVNNLVTITGYSGLTPMINSSVIDGTLGIDDKNIMPVYRSYTIGLSIQF